MPHLNSSTLLLSSYDYDYDYYDYYEYHDYHDYHDYYDYYDYNDCNDCNDYYDYDYCYDYSEREGHSKPY